MATYPSTAAGIVRISNTSFSIAGDWTAELTPQRSLRIINSSGSETKGIYVVSTTVSNGITTVTTEGNALPSVISSISPGQDVYNAPKPSVPTGGGADNVLAKNSASDRDCAFKPIGGLISPWFFEFYS